VYELLERAKDPQSIIAAVPELITPKILASVLITINKWRVGRVGLGEGGGSCYGPC